MQTRLCRDFKLEGMEPEAEDKSHLNFELCPILFIFICICTRNLNLLVLFLSQQNTNEERYHISDCLIRHLRTKIIKPLCSSENYHLYCPTVEGYLGCFQVWAIVNNAAINLFVSYWGKYQRT